MSKLPMQPAGWPQGLARTRARVLIWELLEAASAPLDARAIYERLDAGAVSLSSVYRALESFCELGVVERSTLLKNGTACYALALRGHRHFAICMGCHKVVEVLDCPMKEAPPRLEEARFRVLGHELQLYGYCADCDAAPPEVQRTNSREKN